MSKADLSVYKRKAGDNVPYLNQLYITEVPLTGGPSQ